MKFVDQVRVRAKAGDGGDGCCSFRREKYIPKGGPDGGDGGRGGDVILRADEHTGSLVALYYEPLVRAKSGARGQGSNKSGRSAPPLIVKVPPGTLVHRLPEGAVPRAPDPENPDAPQGRAERPDTRSLEAIADLSAPGMEYVLCEGGAGGKGNTHFKSSTNRAPRRTTDGVAGEEGWFLLELRTIADVGLVGYPNAGKSTLLGRISAAHPKVAAYPFTTLNPHVGIVELPEYRRIAVADIPGLIEGAHENKGLGHEFLRHILRCKRLLFVIDAAATEGRDPVKDVRELRKELKLYDAALAAKPWAIAANKIDQPAAAGHLESLRAAFPKQLLLPISASRGDGLDALKRFFETTAQAE